MKLVSYLKAGEIQLGAIVHEGLYNLQSVNENLPKNIIDFFQSSNELIQQTEKQLSKIADKSLSIAPVKDFTLLAPVPRPTSCRDGYAFRQHVESARRNRGVEMIKEFDQYPIFYFTNHNAVQGPGDVYCMPDHFRQLDFELEAAVVLGKRGRNVKAKDADQHIAGYMIMNDMSARLLQMEEMKLNLGPAKGKDFSTVIGPYMVTPDELEAFKVPAKKDHEGNNYNLSMKCWVNGVQVSEGNMGDMDWTFAEIIERCAYGADIFPGDVIGSGTVGTGCFLELNGTGKLNDPNYPVQWLQEGDVVEMSIDGLGCLQNTIKKENSDFSILNLKKK